MGEICPELCPCLRSRKMKDYPYDVHEQTFEIEENVQNLGENSPKNNHNDNNSNILTEELRTSQESNDRSPYHEAENHIPQVSSNSFEEVNERKEQSHEELTSTKVGLVGQEQKELISKPEEPKKVEEAPKFHANILKPKAPRKKYNPEDYRFKDEEGSFKVKKLDSIKQQQFNIDNCKNSSFFIFDISANVYIDDSQNCFIFIGPTESTIFVRSCKNLTIVAITKQFRTYECHTCTFSLYCKSQPVIESSSELVFTSFNSPIYEQLLPQIKKKRFQPWNNHWSEIHNFTKKAGQEHHKLDQNVDFSEINWKKAFDEAELQISQIKNPFPLIMGNLPYESVKVLLILINEDVENEIVLEVLKGAVILKGCEGVLTGEGKTSKRAILIDALEFMPEKYEEIGTVYSDPNQISERRDKWFISFGDERQK